MEMTAQDYAERAKRIDDGTASDDDRRLVELYEREGFVRDGDGLVGKLVITGEAEVVKGTQADKAAAAKKVAARKRAGDKAQ